MKKIFEAPSISIMAVETSSPILSASSMPTDTTNPAVGGGGGNGDGLAREHNADINNKGGVPTSADQIILN